MRAGYVTEGSVGFMDAAFPGAMIESSQRATLLVPETDVISQLIASAATRVALVACAAVALAAAPVAQAQSAIPARFTDKELRQLNADFSEPGGYFRSDNLLSNEVGYQFVIPELLTLIKPGGIYLGVGPEQNFTYIVALKPRIAIIVDIRRGNMIEHLMYKALFELSSDRADFLSRLFSRSRPAGLDSTSTPAQLFEAFVAERPDSILRRKNLAAIKTHLTKTHGFAMDSSDTNSLEYIFGAFYAGGPLLDYSYPRGGFGGFGPGGMPTYATLQTATDSAGKNWAFLASEASFRWLKDFQTRNLLIPVVGDFAGPKAIRAVGEYLKRHNAVVAAFYTSNVEQYLFQQSDDWRRYYENVATLPLDSTSSFIRSLGLGRSAVLPPRVAVQAAMIGRMRAPSVTSSMVDLIKAFKEGRLVSYTDVINLSR